MTEFRIMGKYHGETEEVDAFDDKSEAERCLSEYRMAYGSDWDLWIMEV